MAERSVMGADGREWNLRSELEWRTPATADDFEHDVAGGYVPAAIMVVMVVLFTLALVLWMPDSVVLPAWVILLLLLIILFFPLRWVVRRPWKVVAETEGDLKGAPAERWVGTVRGMLEVRTEMNRIKQSIEDDSLPDFNGPLRPVE
jgi:hypothetical protein